MTEFDSLLRSIETAVNDGKAVVTAGKESIITMMQEALWNGRSVTFYVSPTEAQAVMRWYWTPGRIKEVGLEPVSIEERARIQSELGVKDMGPYFSNRLECQLCGGVYGGFEFIEQGIRVHGKDWVGAVVALKNVAILRINPVQDAFCPKCAHPLAGGHYYSMYQPGGTMSYACCGGTIPKRKYTLRK